MASKLSLPLILIIFVSCNSRRIADLESINDSLRREIDARNKLLLAVNASSGALDSLYEKNSQEMMFRSWLNRRYADTMQVIHARLNETNGNLVETRNKLTASEQEALAYSLMVAALQDEVKIRDGEIVSASEMLARNQQNYQTYISQMQGDIRSRDSELAKLQTIIEQLKKLNEAESYFIKARDLEERAEKMRFTRKKKRETLMEALELYQKSFLLGKKEAAPKIESLRKALG